MAVIAFFYLLQVLSERFAGIDLPFAYLGKFSSYLSWAAVAANYTGIPALFAAAFSLELYALYVLGVQLEGIYGHRRFLLLFFIAAFGGNVLSFVLTPASSLGASTAIFGLLAAEIIFVVQNRRYLGGRTRALLTNLLFVLFLNLIIGFNPASSY